MADESEVDTVPGSLRASRHVTLKVPIVAQRRGRGHNLAAAFVEEGARLLAFVRSRAGGRGRGRSGARPLARGSANARWGVSRRLPARGASRSRSNPHGGVRASPQRRRSEMGPDISGLDATITVG